MRMSKSTMTVNTARSSAAFDIFAPDAPGRPHTSPGPGEFGSIDQSLRSGLGDTPGTTGDRLDDRRDSLSPLSHKEGGGHGPDSGFPMSPGASYMSPLGVSSARDGLPPLPDSSGSRKRKQDSAARMDLTRLRKASESKRLSKVQSKRESQLFAREQALLDKINKKSQMRLTAQHRGRSARATRALAPSCPPSPSP